MKPGLFFLLFLYLPAAGIIAQTRPGAKFGKITVADFKTPLKATDSSAGAVVIADIGSTEIVGNDKNSFSLEFRNYRRARIINRNGYGIANVEIPVYADDELEEDLSSLRAVTYNLEDGRVVRTKLNIKGSVFKNRIDRNRVVRVFTFPNIREGSIIEYEYTLRSDFMFNLHAWDFQGAYPVQWSEYRVSIPEFYNYVTLSQGYQPFSFKEQKEKREVFVVEGDGRPGRVNFTAAVTETRWVMQQVPALKEENYTSTLKNHVSRIEFQLAELREPVFVSKKYMSTWEEIAADLLQSEDFGYSIFNDTGWLGEIVDTMRRPATDSLSLANTIYRFVQDNMTCTNYSRVKLEGPLRTIYRSRNGSVAGVNLLLTALLRKAGFAADPVILSTRSHGYVYAKYPLMDRFNYVITQLRLNGKTWYIDASRPGLGFGKLGYECYNGHARVINEEATPVEFMPDSLLERKQVSIAMMNNAPGTFSGTVQQSPGYYESLNLRALLKSGNPQQLYSELGKTLGVDRVTELSIDSLEKGDEPLTLRYHFDWQTGQPELIYFNPMMGEGWKSNPFASAERFYPVEMPYGIDETYILRLDIPAGYEVEELPGQMMVRLNEEDEGHFEYRISESNGVISVRSRVRVSRAFFLPEEYEMLREFFNLVVRKHNEQIVFRKKS